MEYQEKCSLFFIIRLVIDFVGGGGGVEGDPGTVEMLYKRSLGLGNICCTCTRFYH